MKIKLLIALLLMLLITNVSTALQPAPQKVPGSTNIYILTQPDNYQFYATYVGTDNEYSGNLREGSFSECTEISNDKVYCKQTENIKRVTFQTDKTGESYWVYEDGKIVGSEKYYTPYNYEDKKTPGFGAILLFILLLCAYKIKMR